MNDRSSHQVFNFNPRVPSPTLHFRKVFDGRSLNDSPPNYGMAQSLHLTSDSSKLFGTNDPCQDPNYYSLRVRKNQNNLISKDNTLSRQRSMNNYDMARSFNGYDRKMENNLKHEHCLNWLESGNSYEQEHKELDANIQLLMWKKKHMEILHKQKIKEKQTGECQKLQDSSTTIASDSPPPLSDFFKPELSSVSADDGFESAVDAFNHQVNTQHISYLEGELRKRDMKIQLYQQMMAKKQDSKGVYNKDLGFLTPQRTSFDPSSFSNYNHHNNTLDSSFQAMRMPSTTNTPDKLFYSESSPNNRKTSTPDSKTPVRPTSFNSNLFHSHTLDRSSTRSPFKPHNLTFDSYPPATTPLSSKETRASSASMEVLKLKSELLVKEQHLRKTRGALKELSGRYNDLLSQHMRLVQSNDNHRRSLLTSPALNRDGPPHDNNGSFQRRSFIDELNEVIEQLHRIVNHKRLFPAGREANTASSQRSLVDKDLSMLHHSIKQLRSRLLSSNQHPPSDDDDHADY